ncbi:MAG: lipoyl synthase [Candidatus Margulisiibacteriota bacterium]
MLPSYLKKRIPKTHNVSRLREALNDPSIHTVCESLKCPNIGECFSKNTLTFMILGDVCTRNCAFCGCEKGMPLPVDPDEPEKILESVRKLKLNYVVITSVTRDDLPDGGASHFSKAIRALHSKGIAVEVLIPDFLGNPEALNVVVRAKPEVINHNVETVPRLYPDVRPQADYKRSLNLLLRVKEANPAIYTKSGIMVGLGETDEEVFSVLRDLKGVGCDIVTLGQYLPPSKTHQKAERFVEPESFLHYERVGYKMGFLKVFSGPFVRSSYKAEEILCFQNNQKDY